MRNAHSRCVLSNHWGRHDACVNVEQVSNAWTVTCFEGPTLIQIKLSGQAMGSRL